MARSAAVLDLPITLPDTDAPLRHRVSEAVVDLIRSGALGPGDRLPSTRALARQLGVGRGAVVEAYDELFAAGFVNTAAGSGTRVAPQAAGAALAGATSHVTTGPVAEPGPGPARTRNQDDAQLAQRRHRHPVPPGDDNGEPAPGALDLRPGAPDTTLVNRLEWRRAWRHAAGAPVDEFAWVRTRHTELQRALSAHLRRTRGVVADPTAILVVPGVNAVLSALVDAAGWRGRTVALEDPGYVDPYRALIERGATPRPVPVDASGLDPSLLRRTDAAAYVTPAHQYPLGGRLPVDRRCALVDWAVDNQALLVEDDYDGEFRYDVSPLPALQSLAGAADRVVYVGTASKVLTPSLRLAWVVPPPWLREPMARTLEDWGLTVNPVTSRALARLIDTGALARHLARAGRLYAARRAALVAALTTHCPHLELTGVSAGLHLVARLPDDVDDTAVVLALEERGVHVSALAAYCAERAMTGLVLGYARLPETRADSVGRAIAAVLG